MHTPDVTPPDTTPAQVMGPAVGEDEAYHKRAIRTIASRQETSQI